MSSATGIAIAPARNTNEVRTKLRILLVEDNAADSELVLRELRRGGFEVSAAIVQSAQEFRDSLKNAFPDLVLADYNLGHWRGMEALEIIKSEGLNVPLILVSGALGDVTAVECIKQGATDYVLKDSLARLPVSVARALQEKRLREERKIASEQLARNMEDLARSNAELEQFAYVASHDLQEPLRMITAYTQLLSEKYSGRLDEQADKYIAYAVDGATRMQTLIQDLLAFSRAGNQTPMQESHDSNVIVQRALKNLQVALQESGAVVKYENLPMILGNGSQLQQVFQNLIGNALKFRGQDTAMIQINAERSAESNSDRWTFAVTDNGIGIAPENLANIFAVFHRLHTRTEYPGNGIGLSICKKIIERHGGTIWAESQIGHGCKFKFTLQGTRATDQ
jgi:signal transduction histidine kinase